MVIAKTTLTIAQALFLLMGLLAAVQILPAGSELLHGMRWVVSLECLAVAGFVGVQMLGVAGAIGRVLERVGVTDRQGPAGLLPRIDRELADFYRRMPARLALSVFWHLAGWSAGMLEGWLIMRALNLPVSLATALVVETVDAGIAFAAFMIPGRAGVQEAGHVAAFVALGLGAPNGLAFTVVRRLRQVTWAGLGYLALASLRSRMGYAPPAPAVLEPEA